MKFRTTIVRSRMAALIACSLITTLLPPFTAVAEYNIPAGSGAVITAGQPLSVRATPGWDGAISYEIADGSSVTVWDVAQTAPDGSLWYPVDGGFVPVDSVTSVATLDGGFSLFQDVPTEEWVEPAAEPLADSGSGGWIDPATGLWVDPAAAQASQMDQTGSQGWTDPATGLWVEPAVDAWVEPAAEGWIDPATGLWVDPAVETLATGTETTDWVEPAVEGWIDPATGLWVEPSVDSGNYPVADVTLAQEAVTEEWVEPVTDVPMDAAPLDAAPVAEEWVDPAAVEVVAEPVTEEWVEPVPVVDALTAPVVDDWVETAPVEAVVAPVAEEWVEPAPADTGTSGDSWGEPIGAAYISGTSGDGAACRVSAERGSDKLAVLGEGEQVEVRGEAIGEWQPVNCAGLGGYVNASFISWEPAAAAAPAATGRGRNRDGGGGSGSGTGQSMVSFAMQYVGYPYAYAGEGPYAFDCSGFTKFVAQNALGVDITHDMFQQIGAGQSVGMNELQPGDLVFFSNTFRPGLSHVGIYIGDGQFVHAENESTGVKVSDLNSDYYASRWSGGTRLA